MLGEVAAFIWQRAKELPVDGYSEEQIILEVCERFGPPSEGNTDWLRYAIRKAQGRPTRWEFR